MRIVISLRNSNGSNAYPMEPLLLAANPKRRGYLLRLLVNEGLVLEGEALRRRIRMSDILPRLTEIGADAMRTAILASASATGSRVSLCFVNPRIGGTLYQELVLLPKRLRPQRVLLLAHYGALMFHALNAVGGYPAKLRGALFGEFDPPEAVEPKSVASTSPEAVRCPSAPAPAGVNPPVKPNPAPVAESSIVDDADLDIPLDLVRAAMADVRA